MSGPMIVSRQIDVAKMPGGYSLSIPVHEVKGSGTGPHVCVLAAQHGNEVTTVGAAVEFLQWVGDTDLQGRVTVIPVANPITFETRTRSTWQDGLYGGTTGNLANVWPGHEHGFFTQRIAKAISSVIPEVDCVIDVHSAGDSARHLSYGYVGEQGADSEADADKLALAFGMEIMLAKPAHDLMATGRLADFAAAHGVPTLTVELGEFYGFGDDADRSGPPLRTPAEVLRTGVLNVLSTLSGRSEATKLPARQVIVSPETRCRPEQGGLLVSKVTRRDIGRVLRQGEVLGRVFSPWTLEEVSTITTPYSQNLLVSATFDNIYQSVCAGDQAFHVADFSTARWKINS